MWNIPFFNHVLNLSIKLKAFSWLSGILSVLNSYNCQYLIKSIIVNFIVLVCEHIWQTENYKYQITAIRTIRTYINILLLRFKCNVNVILSDENFTVYGAWSIFLAVIWLTWYVPCFAKFRICILSSNSLTLIVKQLDAGSAVILLLLSVITCNVAISLR